MQNYKLMVLRSTDAAPALVDAALNGYYQQIRHTVNAAALLMLELPQIAKAYGGREVMTDYVLNECIRIILEKFGNISIDEIKTAYRMWSAGELATQGSAEMYGGSFNAGNVGKVLSAYCDRRKKVIAAFLSEKDKVDEQQREQERTERQRAQFEAALLDWWHNARPADWRELPLHRCETAISRGWVTATKEEMTEIMDDARQIAEMELSGKIEEARGRGIRAMGEMRQLQAMLKEKDSPSAQTIFSKLLVFRKHFLP